MKALIILFIVSLTYLTMSCAPLLLDYDYDRDTDFTRLRTFDWLPVRVKADELAIKHVKGAVNRELEAKGFTKNQANPDFLIAIHGKKVKRKEVVDFGPPAYRHVDYGWHGSHGGSDRYQVFEWEEGTYTLAIVDADSKELMWRGTVEGEVYPYTSAEKRRERIYNTIANILNNFPPPNK